MRVLGLAPETANKMKLEIPAAAKISYHSKPPNTIKELGRQVASEGKRVGCRSLVLFEILFQVFQYIDLIFKISRIG